MSHEAYRDGAGVRTLASAAHIAAEELIALSDDLVTDHDSVGDPPDRYISAVMKLALTHPTVPLKTLFVELRHADVSVPLGADDRDEIITRLVEARLGQQAASRDNDPPIVT